MRHERDFLELLRSSIDVDHQKVTYAKSYFLANYSTETISMLNSLMENVEAVLPHKVVLHESVDTKSMISQAANAISWHLAGCEAIWGLISSGLLIPRDLNLIEQNRNLGWTTVIPGSGGSSGGWNLEDLTLPVPKELYMPKSSSNNRVPIISDPDIYLNHFDVNNIDSVVNESLREAVLCFKNGLYLGSVALLGRASEGSWLHLGRMLVEYALSNGYEKEAKLLDLFIDIHTGISKKVDRVISLYEKREIFSEIYTLSGFHPKELRSSSLWSDTVRESRNSLHYENEPPIANTYEKVGIQLIGAVPAIKMMYGIVDTIKTKLKE